MDSPTPSDFARKYIVEKLLEDKREFYKKIRDVEDTLLLVRAGCKHPESFLIDSDDGVLCSSCVTIVKRA